MIVKQEKESPFICVSSAYIPEGRKVKPVDWQGYIKSVLKVEHRGLDKHVKG